MKDFKASAADLEKQFNELNRTHWAVKRVDLLDELSSAHIALF